MTLVTFIIPIRHPDNAQDWDALTARLRQTMASVANQSHRDWRGIVVANHDAALPPMPEGFSVVRVGFPPNDLHELEKGPREAVLDAFRLDKGRRVLAGMRAAPATRFFMIVDDDDLVSADITAHAAAHADAHGWFVDQGYLWNEDGGWLFAIDGFNHLCGTSLIIRADHYRHPEGEEAETEEWIKDTLGSHVRIAPRLAENGTPLQALPFAGAIYRIGHLGAHSQSAGLFRMKFFNRRSLTNPRIFLGNLRRLRKIGTQFRANFFGSSVSMQ